MLEVKGITTRFETRAGDVKAVNDVSFSVGSGEIVGIVGESGCGKSATIRSILGLVPPPGRVVAGEVLLDGKNLLAMSKRRLRQIRGAQIGFVAQNPFGALNPILRIDRQFHNVISAHRKHVSRADSRAMARDMLVSVGIPGPDRVLDGHAHELSGGMAQRVVLAMAIVLDPQLVIADEPTTALDVTIQRQILDLMREVVTRDERSMLLVTHDLGVVAQHCDRVVVMYAGRVVESGPVASVFSRPAHPYTSALIRAVPRRGRRVHVLQGRVPNLIDYPPGCPYADRCAHRIERCRVEVPELLPVFPQDSATRVAACHVPEEEVSADVAHAS